MQVLSSYRDASSGRPFDLAVFRKRLAIFIDGPLFSQFIICVILLNAFTLGLETSETVTDALGWEIFAILNNVILAIFVAELLTRLFAEGLQYFTSGWNWFDLLIVTITIIPVAYSIIYDVDLLEENDAVVEVAPQSVKSNNLMNQLAILRVLRVLRLFRIMRTAAKLRIIIETFMSVLPSMTWIVGFLMLIYYIWALIGTTAFGDQYQAWPLSIVSLFFSLPSVQMGGHHFDSSSCGKEIPY